ncbi:sensor histidine kinase [Flavobacterium tegetincola]|uniref:sensor histidine kinase n=1 Tax=Flavobacterium tegetincola TaxID=150172 RepID=UPI0004787020|nr:HAMP domain-containing sensor histidine kinase [Flavobacterium tegetincola]
MKSKVYTYILFIITLNILATVGLQIFWNIKNYKENKSQLIKDVQTAFDNSIEYYYLEDSKNDFLAFVSEDTDSIDPDFINKARIDTVFNKGAAKSDKNISKFKKTEDTLQKSSDSISYGFAASEIQYMEGAARYEEIVKPKGTLKDLKKAMRTMLKKDPDSLAKIKVLRGKKASDSISKLKNIVNKIIISVVKDSLEFSKVATALDKELLRKNIDISYSIQHFKADTLFAHYPKEAGLILPLKAVSATTYLPSGQQLKISFTNPTLLILKRSFTGIFLSLLLSISILSCLMFLLRIIQKQKKIDAIKNDLISNITHEFKTPITTIATAIEGIKHFNADADQEKTNRYLDISTQQLLKLEIMVEKLLETASLNSDQLKLNKEEIDIATIVRACIEKHQMTSEKQIKFASSETVIQYNVDVFHFENAVSNLIDNAIKYGGSNIMIAVIQSAKQIEISIEDDGIGIENTQHEKIFEQFYRIPKGNIHDVKGFGIGLYYAKKIIEKHGGILELLPRTAKTIFKITLFHVK